MVEIPSLLRSVFTASIEEQDGTYIVEVPSSEVKHEAVSADETYRVVILESPSSAEQSMQQGSQQRRSQKSGAAHYRTPLSMMAKFVTYRSRVSVIKATGLPRSNVVTS